MNELSEQQHWLQLHREEIIDPGRPIVDPHHHLWRKSSLDPYLLEECLAVARSAPETVMVLDHFGTPLGVGPYASQREEIFEQWRLGIADIATCENVVAKLGGMAMPDNGFGWMGRDVPPGSDEFVAAQARYSEAEQDAMFYKTAARVYSLD